MACGALVARLVHSMVRWCVGHRESWCVERKTVCGALVSHSESSVYGVIVSHQCVACWCIAWQDGVWCVGGMCGTLVSHSES